MINIGTVIGWKFNHQPGMSTIDGKITAFPGGIPSEEDQSKWSGEYEQFIEQQKIYTQIEDLENSITPRNYREFVLGVKYSIDKINKVDAAIELLRAEL